ncbi:MAG: glycosyltransferase [Planctomycetes bacterium]|nr:glycosyltransferase [Planctomycetota bacterium]
MNIVILGLSISSSWGNGHATTYRGLVRGLAELGHDVLFLERDVPWYASHRDLPSPPYCTLRLYGSLEELTDVYAPSIRHADAVLVGSYVPQGVAVGRWALDNAASVVAFYDIDTPITLAKLAKGDYEYLSPELIARYHLYLSFTGGRILRVLREQYRSPRAAPLYCSADPQRYRPVDRPHRWRMGYLGACSDDRQPAVERLLLGPARRMADQAFVAAGPQYPAAVRWPSNVERLDHVPADEHNAFYASQDVTLNVTRREMVRYGCCPSVRLFEAAACGTAVISDDWEGLADLFEPGREILIARSTEEAVAHLSDRTSDDFERIGYAARRRFLAEHTCEHRAAQLERMLLEAREDVARPYGADVPFAREPTA